MTYRILGAAVLAWLAVSGCAYSTKPFVATTVAAPAEVDDVDLYGATVRVLLDRGYALDVNDPSAGIVSTDLVEVERNKGDMNRALYHAWRVGIEAGMLELSIECVEISNGESYACDGDARHAQWVNLAPGLREAIFASARRRAAYRLEHGRRTEAEIAAAVDARPPAPAHGVRPELPGERVEPTLAGGVGPRPVVERSAPPASALPPAPEPAPTPTAPTAATTPPRGGR